MPHPDAHAPAPAGEGTVASPGAAPPAATPPAATTCAGCSACCEEQGLPPGYLLPERLTFLPQALRDEIAAHQQEERETGWTRHERRLPCIWLNLATGLCNHYDLRPDICRTFPTGSEGCAFWRSRRADAHAAAAAAAAAAACMVVPFLAGVVNALAG